MIEHINNIFEPDSFPGCLMGTRGNLITVNTVLLFIGYYERHSWDTTIYQIM